MKLRVLGTIALTIGTFACSTKLNSSLSGDGDLKPRSSPVAAGEMAPDFTLEDQNNRKVTLSAGRGSKPTVLVFYRGHW